MDRQTDCFRVLHIHHRRELRSRYTTTGNRPDIVFFDSNIGNNVDLDISLAHPWSSDIFPSSAGVSGDAAERRADRKKEKYSKQQLPGGMIATVTPLVMEHFGAWGIDGGTPVQVIKEVIRQSGTTKRCGVYRLLVQILFCSAPEVQC